MSQIALIGLPNVGKSTVFSALTNEESQIDIFPFSTNELLISFAEIKDERLRKASIIENDFSGQAICKRNNIDINTPIIPIKIPVTKNCLEIIL